MRTKRLNMASTERLKSRLSMLNLGIFHITRREYYQDDDGLYDQRMRLREERGAIMEILMERRNG